MLTRVRRCAVALATGISIALAPGTPVLADDGTGGATCTNAANPSCDVYAGGGSDSGGSGGSSGSGGQSDASDDSSDNEASQCVYTPAELSDASVAALGGQPEGEGGWYFKTCYGDDGSALAYPGPIWIAGAAPAVSPESLARQARSKLRLPRVVMALNPSGDQLVNLPTWLALDSSSWVSQWATASAGSVTVTATASPVSVTWSMGTGDTVDCHGPGTAWTVGVDPMAASPDCGYTYQRSSAGATGEAFAVTATVTWEVTWAGAGQSGTIAGLSTVGSAEVRVVESQAVLVN